MFQIEWIPIPAIEALADERGRTDREESPLDWCDHNEAVECAEAETFAEALAIAKSKLPEDFFGQVRIERLVKISSRYMRDRWDADAVWHLSAFYHDEADMPKEDEPEYCPEIDLIEDEQIVA